MKSKSAFHPKQAKSPTTFIDLQDPDHLRWEMQQVQLAIARRAYELFEARGCQHGYEREDWFRAESELLRPVSVSMSETAELLNLRVNVFGFEPNEINASVEPRRITILGKKEVCATESEGGKLEYIDWSPDLLLQSIDLATEVVPESAIAELSLGILTFQIRKAAQPATDSVRAAAA